MPFFERERDDRVRAGSSNRSWRQPSKTPSAQAASTRASSRRAAPTAVTGPNAACGHGLLNSPRQPSIVAASP